MNEKILQEFTNNTDVNILRYSSDQDTYIRKNAYLITGRLYRDHESLQDIILSRLRTMLAHKDELVRQTAVNALGEIGKYDTEPILPEIEKAMTDEHHKVRNAVIGALKKMGEKNPKPILRFVKKYLDHPDPKIRREIIHGMELRGRTHPEDVLPLLKEVQFETNSMVKKMIIHVIAQISYKKGCLEKVIAALNVWENRDVVKATLIEIIEVHKNYEKFSYKSAEEAERFIENNTRKSN